MASPFAAIAAQLQKTNDALKTIGGLLERSVARKGVEAAEKASSKFQVFHQAVEKVSASLKNMGTVASVAGIISAGAIQRMVAIANPAAIDQLHIAFRSLSGVLGQMFAPVVQKVTVAVREVATWLYNLSPAVKATIVAVAAASVVAVTAIGAITTGIVVLNAALALTNVLSGGWVAVIGLVATAVVGTTAALAGGAAAAAYFGKSFQGVKDAAWEAWSVIRQIGSAIWQSMRPIVTALGDALKLTWEKMKPGFDLIKDAAAGLIATFQAILPMTNSVADSLRGPLAGAADFIANVFVGLAHTIDKMVDEMAKLLITVNLLADALKNGRLLGDFEGVMRIVSQQVSHYQRLKEEARRGMKAERQNKVEAPVFDQNFHYSGIAEAKQEIALASLRASAGQQSPEEKQTSLLEKLREAMERGNNFLQEVRDAVKNAPRGLR